MFRPAARFLVKKFQLFSPAARFLGKKFQLVNLERLMCINLIHWV